MSERSKGGTSRPVRGNTAKDRYFSILIKLLPTGEVFPLRKIHNEMRVSELKNLAEYATGIPVNMQRLCYLDDGDLIDSADVRSNDIIPSGVLQMNVWNMWRTLVEAVALNDADWVFKLGVTEDIEYKTPTSEHMHPRMRQEWIANRAFIALYIAAHRGHLKLVEKLINAGANVNGVTSLGHTPLHVAAAQGHGHMVDLLLERGADIDAVDKLGENALAAACKFDHKDCERHLFLFRWQQRAKDMKPQEMRELFAHQFFDSSKPVWLKGGHAQIYYTQILPPGEYQGTGLGAPKRLGSGKSGDSNSDSEDASSESDSSDDDDDSSSGFTSRRRGRGADSASRRKEIKILTSAEVRKKKKKAAKRAMDYGRRKSEHPKGYDDWLARKLAIEQVDIDKRKHEKAARKLAEEDRKRQQDFQDKSYEQWLADKETKKTTIPIIAPPQTQQPGSNNAKKPLHSNNPLLAPVSNSNAAAHRHLIKNVARRKEEEMAGRGLVPYDEWLGQSEGRILEQIRAGRTPLQRIIEKISI